MTDITKEETFLGRSPCKNVFLILPRNIFLWNIDCKLLKVTQKLILILYNFEASQPFWSFNFKKKKKVNRVLILVWKKIYINCGIKNCFPNSLSQLRNQVRSAMWEKLRKGKKRQVHKTRVVKYEKRFPRIYKSITGIRPFLRHFS